MDEKMVAVVGAVAGAAMAGRGLRPVAKLVMRGVVTAVDATTGAGREVAALYAEARAEQHGSAAAPSPATTTAAASEPA